jgi:hypothetical protein
MVSAEGAGRHLRRNSLKLNRFPPLRRWTPDNTPKTQDMFVGRGTTMTAISRHRQTAKRHDGRRSRSRIPVGLVALVAVMMAGCSSSSGSTAVHGASGAPATSLSTTVAPAAPAAAHGVEAAIGDVPWSKVGPGWMLAMWSPVTPHMPGVQPAPGEATPDTPAPSPATRESTPAPVVRCSTQIAPCTGTWAGSGRTTHPPLR